MLRKTASSLHPHLDSGNLLTVLAKTFGKPWHQLPELDGDGTAVGVDDDFAMLQIGDAGAGQQVGRQCGVEKNLQVSQPVGVLGETSERIGGGKVVRQAVEIS